MTRRIVVNVGGTSAVARLLDDRAPLACAKIWDALPIEATLHHARWSGHAVVAELDRLRDRNYEPEDPCSLLAVGSIKAQDRSAAGPEWATRLAVLEGDAAALLETFATTRSRGAAPLTIARIG